ncbi:MAG TPA: ATP-binding protein, partial [Novosphingobium sp.]|nr:ATP-binding protein [Novosphingobium sp.]
MTEGFLTWLAEASHEQIAALMKRIPEQEIEQWPYDWKVWGRTSQQAPAGDWRVWLVMAGRGFGKTRLGAE